MYMWNTTKTQWSQFAKPNENCIYAYTIHDKIPHDSVLGRQLARPGCLALEVNPDGSIRDVINHLSHLQKKTPEKKPHLVMVLMVLMVLRWFSMVFDGFRLQNNVCDILRVTLPGIKTLKWMLSMYSVISKLHTKMGTPRWAPPPLSGTKILTTTIDIICWH